MIRNLCKSMTTNLLRNLLFSSSLQFKFAVEQSKYFRPKDSVEDFIKMHHFDYKMSNEHYKLKICPFCKKPHNNDGSNLYVLNVHKNSGVFFCFRCNAKGSWFDFKKSVLGINVHPLIGSDDGEYSSPVRKQPIHAKISDAEYFIYKLNLDQEQNQDIRKYLHERGFADETIRAFNLGCSNQIFYGPDQEEVKVKSIYFPMYRILNPNQEKQKLLNQVKQTENDQIFVFHNNITEIVKVKIRGCGKENKKWMKQYPIGSQKGFFGLNLIKETDKEIIITEGEYDAMAVYQATGRPAISLPQGVTNLPDVLLPYLDRFEKVILWLDNDDAGIINLEKIAYKLGLSRTYLVRHNFQCKDANDFLKKDPVKIKELLNSAKTIPDQNILNFNSLRDSIKNRVFREEENIGVRIDWFKFFNRKVKGVRLSELSIVSGPTGSGKTTLLSQLSLTMCKQGIPVLWGSFEIRNEILVTNMLTQNSEVNLSKNKEHFDYYADQFAKLPLFYLSFYGSNDIDKVLATIIYSIEKYNISMVVIDTLQFLISEQGEGFKKFQIQDSLMAKLRKITIDYNVHIVIVIHPRKTEDNEDIGIHSIYGTSKATQEADNIWIVQNRDSFKIFDVKKNRYDGEIGKCALGFNKETKSFLELNKTELQYLINKEKDMNEIIAIREDKKSQKDTMSKEEILGEEIQEENQPHIDESMLAKKIKTANKYNASNGNYSNANNEKK